MTAQVATTVLGGFLGAGKTTLINRLLRAPEGRRIAVLVNDFGDVAVDELLIEAEDGRLVSLANGCVCCSMGGDFAGALDRVLGTDVRPDHLVIEASGVAEPDRIADIARAEPDLRLNAVVTLVDAAQIQAQFSDPRLSALIHAQIGGADLALVNKTDLVADPQAVSDWLRSVAPEVPIILTRQAEAPTELILGDLERASDGGFWSRAAPAQPTAGHAETRFARWSAQAAQGVERAALDDFLARLPPAVLRLKGWVTLADGGRLAVQWVARRSDCRSLDRAPAAGPMTQLTAIGLAGELEPAALDRLFADTWDRAS